MRPRRRTTAGDLMMATDGVVIVADDRWAVRSRVRTWLGSCSRWRRRLSTTTAPCPLAGTRHVLGGIEGERLSRASMSWSMWRNQQSCANTMAAGPRGHDKCALNLTDTRERWNWQVERAQRTRPDRTVSTVINIFVSPRHRGPGRYLQRRGASTFQDDLRVRNRNVLYSGSAERR